MTDRTTRPALADALGHSTADKRLELLRGIARSGSISQAARDAGVSYKAGWQAVATLTNLAGVPLVERVVGGAGGGGARLTAQGEQLLRMAQAYDEARVAVAQRAGPAGAAARLGIRTSMRTQLPATIARLEAAGRRVNVVLALGEGVMLASADALVATITRESAELLGLAPGLPVLALCKATAVRIAAADAAAAAVNGSGNALPAQVARLWRDAEGDEVAVALAGSGLELVGFAAPGVALRKRQRVLAQVDASAVVVALPG